MQFLYNFRASFNHYITCTCFTPKRWAINRDILYTCTSHGPYTHTGIYGLTLVLANSLLDCLAVNTYPVSLMLRISRLEVALNLFSPHHYWFLSLTHPKKWSTVPIFEKCLCLPNSCNQCGGDVFVHKALLVQINVALNLFLNYIVCILYLFL